jgi:hypothetical protein
VRRFAPARWSRCSQRSGGPETPVNGGKIAESATFSCGSGLKVHGFVAFSAIKNEDGVSDPGYDRSKALLDVGNGADQRVVATRSPTVILAWSWPKPGGLH